MEAPHLFKPVITSSYNSITDCDYNLYVIAPRDTVSS